MVAESRHILLPIKTELRRFDAVLDADLYNNGTTDGHRANAVAHQASVKAEMRDEDADVFASTEESSRQRAHSWLKPTSFSVPVSGPTRRRIAEGRGVWGRLPISDQIACQLGLRATAEVE
ncbi:hypothetical protein [Methylobacterium sp. E-016]|uniref:hypothetical protein n=1 Tax=Methylobacterium sp. E-016 TaxID=2836556 RepID=UPI001FB8D284|nr:hypothetical protein [Methylobacterium sp. E-016]